MQRLNLLAFLLAGSTSAGLCHADGTFTEPFTWYGDHAATIKNGASTTVWWNSDRWDIQGDTAYIAVSPNTDTPPPGGFFYHADVHKAASANPVDGREDNSQYAVGGTDGVPGVAAMRLDHQSIVSARLRNPMLISATKPGVVSFYASRFVTTGHWWEVAITPTTTVSSGVFTAIPSVSDPLPSPVKGSNVGTNGPGHRPAVDSINVIATGFPDIPTCNNQDWRVRFAVNKSVNKPAKAVHVVNQRPSMASLTPTNPAELEELYPWEVRFFPNRIELYSDFDRNGALDLIETFTTAIPWNSVYVHFIGAAYQADHHPQVGCGWQGQTRELVWRNISVSPVAYADTVVFPKESGAINTPKDTGWRGYDLRDIQRYGDPVNGIPQANDSAYDLYGTWLYCSGGGWPCTQDQPGKAVQLKVDLPADKLSRVARAQFVYDIRNAVDASRISGKVNLEVNGAVAGTLPPAASKPPGTDQATEWARMSIPLNKDALKAGTNTFRLVFNSAAKEVYIDRMQIELDLQ
jgi:hypothetical protein